MRVTSVVVEAAVDGGGEAELATDMALLAEEALPPSYARWLHSADVPYFFQLDRPPTADVIFQVGPHRFYCHQAQLLNAPCFF